MNYKKNHDAYLSRISSQIRTFRKREKIPMELLGKRLGYCRQTYAEKENNPELLTMKDLLAISDLFGVKVEELIKGANL